jgi:hypothetical protein
MALPVQLTRPVAEGTGGSHMECALILGANS